jgi:hypothetical protein
MEKNEFWKINYIGIGYEYCVYSKHEPKDYESFDCFDNGCATYNLEENLFVIHREFRVNRSMCKSITKNIAIMDVLVGKI